MVIHPQARTTPKLRAEIKAQRDRKQVDLAKQYNVTPQTIRKWQNRDEFTDKSHRPHRLQTKLSEHQEMLVVELRKLLLLPLDDRSSRWAPQHRLGSCWHSLFAGWFPTGAAISSPYCRITTPLTEPCLRYS